MAFQLLEILVIYAGSLSKIFLRQPFSLSQPLQSPGKMKVNGVH